MRAAKKRIHQKPFPVVNARICPVECDDLCVAPDCQSLSLFGSRLKAVFLMQSCGDIQSIPQVGFTEKERAELLWEKAYHDQMAGKEPEAKGYPFCAQCIASLITHFLNDKDERTVALFIATAVATGQEILLFDRNLKRDTTHPAIVLGKFTSLADFRRQYWQQIEKTEMK